MPFSMFADYSNFGDDKPMTEQHTPDKLELYKGELPIQGKIMFEDAALDKTGTALLWANSNKDECDCEEFMYNPQLTLARAVITYNACTGIPTEALESDVIQDLIKNYEELIQTLNYIAPISRAATIQHHLRLLAKLEGK